MVGFIGSQADPRENHSEIGEVGGMSRQRIEMLCSEKQVLLDRSRYRGPILAGWTTEIYSLGRCWRELTGWPRILPLPISNDHGVSPSSALELHENVPHPKNHFTWSSWRVAPDNKHQRKTVVWVTHPWVLYRRSKGIELLPGANGILYFLPHSVPGHNLPEPPIERTLELLAEKRDSGLPIGIMIMMHDVHRGAHITLEKYGCPIYTAGHTSSPFFVDRFYELVRQFPTAVCNSFGSQVFLLEEMGISVQIIGPQACYPESVLALNGLSGTARVASWDAGFRLAPESNADWRTQVTTAALGLGLLPMKSKIRLLFLRNLVVYILVELSSRIFHQVADSKWLAFLRTRLGR